MLKEIIFVTNNLHKKAEIEAILKNKIQVKSLKDINCTEEIPETGSTLEENALQKARYIYKRYQKNCFADDTGLEVEALNNAPGVHSARYAGEENDAEKNMQALLQNMQNISQRKAVFKTVIALIIDGKEFLFEGKVEGEILREKKGDKGFGYDPIFKPQSYDKTFAELSSEEKNKISHRAIAVNQLVRFLVEEKYDEK